MTPSSSTVNALWIGSWDLTAIYYSYFPADIKYYYNTLNKTCNKSSQDALNVTRVSSRQRIFCIFHKQLYTSSPFFFNGVTFAVILFLLLSACWPDLHISQFYSRKSRKWNWLVFNTVSHIWALKWKVVIVYPVFIHFKMAKKQITEVKICDRKRKDHFFLPANLSAQ